MSEVTAPAAPATQTPPPAAPPAAAPPPPSAPAPQASEWTAGLNDELKGYVQNKGFKAPQDVLESYRNFEKLHGVPQERLLKLPEDMTGPEGRQVWERLGAPKESKEYGLKPTDGKPDPMADWAENTFFKLNMPKGMAANLMKEFGSYAEAQRAAQTEQQKNAQTTALNELKTKWGTAFDQNVNMVTQGAIALGMSNDEVAALGSAIGPAKASELLLKLATATGEHSFVTGGGPGGNRVLAPDQAKAKINDLISDKEFSKRLGAREPAAVREWDQAHAMAYPGMSSL